jgi:hypothetical protein
VDPTSGVLYGHVIAISKGYAFIRPAKDVFREIKGAFKSNAVQMPTPFDLLADLSKLSSREPVPKRAYEFAKRSIAADALCHSSESPSAKLIQDVLCKQSSIDRAVLCRILQTTGSDVVGALRDSRIWDSARNGEYGEKELTVEVLKSLSEKAKLPQLIALAPSKLEVNKSGGPSDESGRFVLETCGYR